MIGTALNSLIMFRRVCEIFGTAFLLVIFYLGIYHPSHAATPENNGNERASERTCLPKEPEARSVLEKFIFPGPDKIPAWACERRAGKRILPELDVISSRSQIQALTDPDDTDVCRTLNSKYSEELSDKWATPAGSDETWYAYDIGYFKADEFYFVVMTPTELPQPDDPNLVHVTTAMQRIDIFDSSLNRIRKYAF